MAKGSSKSSSKPSFLKRAFSVRRGKSTKSSSNLVAELPKFDETEVRYVTIELPVDGGVTFGWTVDDHDLEFTAPEGKKMGESYEFIFTFGGGQRKDLEAKALEEALKKAADETAAATAAAASEEAAKPAAAEPASAPAVSSADAASYPALAKEVVDDAISSAIAVNAEASTPTAAVDAPATPDAGLRTWQAEAMDGEKDGSLSRGVVSALAVLLLAVGIGLLLQASGMLTGLMPELAAPPPLPIKGRR